MDADGDSHMDSSSSSDSDSMFPTENDPTTPQQGASQAARFSNVHGSELSPPHSEERGADANPQDVMDTLDTDAAGHELSRKEKQAQEPGWAWKNPKAREECDRSLEYVLDRNFSLRESRERPTVAY